MNGDLRRANFHIALPPTASAGLYKLCRAKGALPNLHQPAAETDDGQGRGRRKQA